MFRELDERDAIFRRPRREFVLGDEHHDTSVVFQGHVAGSPLGPAAGPQSPVASDLVLWWLAGGRILALEAPRPSSDRETVGDHRLRSPTQPRTSSLEEHVKGAMAIRILRASGRLSIPPSFSPLVYDASVGGDRAHIESDAVQVWLAGMKDCRAVVERLRAQIPDELRTLRDLDFETSLADTLTLSPDRGCPPDELERTVESLLDRQGLHCIVALDPTRLGPERLRRRLHDELGDTEPRVPDPAFDRDMRWDEALGLAERLGERFAGHGLRFGVKFAPSHRTGHDHRRVGAAAEDETTDRSRPLLHALAMDLVARFREHFGDRYPISFSAGINARNFADAVSLGLVPITAGHDPLEPGGCGPTTAYFKALYRRMDAVGAKTVDDFVLRAHGHGEAALGALGLDEDERAQCRRALGDGSTLDEAVPDHARASRWLSEVTRRNTKTYVTAATAGARDALA